jgi:hypothetical protein
VTVRRRDRASAEDATAGVLRVGHVVAIRPRLASRSVERLSVCVFETPGPHRTRSAAGSAKRSRYGLASEAIATFRRRRKDGPHPVKEVPRDAVQYCTGSARRLAAHRDVLPGPTRSSFRGFLDKCELAGGERGIFFLQ